MLTGHWPPPPVQQAKSTQTSRLRSRFSSISRSSRSPGSSFVHHCHLLCESFILRTRGATVLLLREDTLMSTEAGLVRKSEVIPREDKVILSLAFWKSEKPKSRVTLSLQRQRIKVHIPWERLWIIRHPEQLFRVGRPFSKISSSDCLNMA